MELIRQRLQLLGIRHQEELAMTTTSLRSVNGSGGVGLQDSGIARALGEILAELHELQAALADGGMVSTGRKK